MNIFVLLLLLIVRLGSEVLDFDLIKMSTKASKDPHILIISGIQGDEPGGFNATNLFLQHYEILEGEVWVIPNLNKHSILKNHRGIYGDMNRKFASLSSKDEEYVTIQRVKDIILDPSIQIIYQLHDGSGFYRHTYVDQLQNPKRWGNCSIIDQKILDGAYYEDLLGLSESITANINEKILKDLHKYHTRNTETKTHDKEMKKSLTFFAIRNGKTALANEASKSLPLNERVYYHLLGIEGMLKATGVKFKRDFELTPQKIYSLLYRQDSYIEIDGLIKLPLFDLRSKLMFFPLPKGRKLSEVQLRSNQNIVGLSQRDKQILIKYGNKVVSSFAPLWVDFSQEMPTVNLEVDGKKENIKMGEIVKIKDYFIVNLKHDGGNRANVIGFRGKKSNEANEIVRLKDLSRSFSIDKAERKFRIEFYNEQDHFLGMIVVHFV